MKNKTASLIALAAVLSLPAWADEAVQLEIVVVENQAVVVQEKAEAGEAAAEAKEAPADSEDKPEKAQPTEAELRDKMRDLERELEQARHAFQRKADEQRKMAQENAQKLIEDIHLPKDPTREQCEAFVADLRKAAEGRRSFSSSDPVTKKLKEVPAEHFDLLVKEMANRTSLRYYANYAMRDMDPERLRPRFVKSLADNPDNISVIVMHGWTQDVRDEVIRYMQAADSSVEPAWFQAAVEIDEPTLYPKLHEIATSSRYASQFVTMLEMLPEYDLAHTVDVCWHKSREGKLSVSYTTFAEKAAYYGNADALGVLVEQLHSSGSYLSHASNYNIRRTGVLKYIDYRGSNEDIQQWYKANKDKLVFDQFRKRFVVREDF